jgi:hypothetical protein
LEQYSSSKQHQLYKSGSNIMGCSVIWYDDAHQQGFNIIGLVGLAVIDMKMEYMNQRTTPH